MLQADCCYPANSGCCCLCGHIFGLHLLLADAWQVARPPLISQHAALPCAFSCWACVCLSRGHAAAGEARCASADACAGIRVAQSRNHVHPEPLKWHTARRRRLHQQGLALPQRNNVQVLRAGLLGWRLVLACGRDHINLEALQHIAGLGGGEVLQQHAALVAAPNLHPRCF